MKRVFNVALLLTLLCATAHARRQTTPATTAEGGRRRYKTLELWLVPPGAELPKPTPDAFPSRNRRRRR